jgi:hypothetical protein
VKAFGKGFFFLSGLAVMPSLSHFLTLIWALQKDVPDPEDRKSGMFALFNILSCDSEELLAVSKNKFGHLQELVTRFVIPPISEHKHSLAVGNTIPIVWLN